MENFVLILSVFEQIPEGKVRGWSPLSLARRALKIAAPKILPVSPRPKCAAGPGLGSPDGGHGACTLTEPCPGPRAPAWGA